MRVEIPDAETIKNNANLMHSVVMDSIDGNENADSILVAQWLIIGEMLNNPTEGDSYLAMLHFATLNLTLLFSAQ